MSVMQINISDSEISGQPAHPQVSHGASHGQGFHSKPSADLDSLMGNLTSNKGSVHAGAQQKQDTTGIIFYINISEKRSIFREKIINR